MSEGDSMKKNGYKSKCKINKIEVTDDTLTGRGWMVLFVKYSSRNFVGFTMERVNTKTALIN